MIPGAMVTTPYGVGKITAVNGDTITVRHGRRKADTRYYNAPRATASGIIKAL